MPYLVPTMDKLTFAANVGEKFYKHIALRGVTIRGECPVTAYIEAFPEYLNYEGMYITRDLIYGFNKTYKWGNCPINRDVMQAAVDVWDDLNPRQPVDYKITMTHITDEELKLCLYHVCETTFNTSDLHEYTDNEFGTLRAGGFTFSRISVGRLALDAIHDHPSSAIHYFMHNEEGTGHGYTHAAATITPAINSDNKVDGYWLHLYERTD